jgi:hypothetical protein
MIEKEQIEQIVKQWVVSDKPNQTVKLKQGWMISISNIRIDHNDIVDYRFILFSPNYQRSLWIDGQTMEAYYDEIGMLSTYIYDSFKHLIKAEGKRKGEEELLNIKEGNIMQTYDRYTLPPSVDKDGF